MRLKIKLLLVFIISASLQIYGCANNEKQDSVNIAHTLSTAYEEQPQDNNAPIALPKPNTPFGFEKLDEEQQALYRAFDGGSITNESPFYLSGEDQKDKKFIDVLMLFTHNNSHISNWNSKSYTVKYNEDATVMLAIISENRTYDKNHEEMVKKFDEAVENLLSRLPGADSDDYTKIKAIAELICDTVTYNNDYYAFLSGNRSAPLTAEDLEFFKHNEDNYGAIVNGLAICSGYSAAFKYLCDKLDVYSICVIGTAGGDAHAWNMVYLDGAYYHVDVTWMDGGGDFINYRYFLASDEEISNDHQDIRYSANVGFKNDPDIAYLFEIPPADRSFENKLNS